MKVRKIKQPVEPKRVASEGKRTLRVSRSVTLADFTDMLARGLSKDEIVDKLGLSINQFETLFSKVHSEGEAEHDMKTPLRHFLDYVMRSGAIGRDLENIKDELCGKDKTGKEKRWYNGQAFVMACNAQLNILDRQVKVGQELGVIHRTPEGYLLIDGQDPRDMDEGELEDAARREIDELEQYIDNGPAKKKKKATILAFKATAGKVDR